MGAGMAYVPFLDPLPFWIYRWGWAMLLLPLCLAVAIVYKSIRCARMSQVPREAAGLFIWIVLGMVTTAAVLVGVAKVMSGA